MPKRALRGSRVPRAAAQEIYTVEDLQDKFSLDRITKSPAVFDKTKLAWMNGQHLRALDTEEARPRASRRRPASGRRTASSTARCKQRSLAHQARSLSLTHEHARGAACFAAADARGGAAQLLPKLASGWTQSGLLAREDGAFVAAAVQLVKNSLELVVDAEPELRRLLAYPLADTLASAAAAPVLEDNFLEARARPSLTRAGLGLGRRCSLASRHGASPAAGGCGHGGGRVARRAP